MGYRRIYANVLGHLASALSGYIRHWAARFATTMLANALDEMRGLASFCVLSYLPIVNKGN